MFKLKTNGEGKSIIVLEGSAGETLVATMEPIGNGLDAIVAERELGAKFAAAVSMAGFIKRVHQYLGYDIGIDHDYNIAEKLTREAETLLGVMKDDKELWAYEIRRGNESMGIFRAYDQEAAFDMFLNLNRINPDAFFRLFGRPACAGYSIAHIENEEIEMQPEKEAFGG